MGSEFLEKTKRSVAKHLDKRRVELCTRHLFTETPADAPRKALAEPVWNVKLTEGETLLIEPFEGHLIARRGTRVVAHLNNPPQSIFRFVADAGGLAGGKVANVNQLSGTVEIAIC